MSWSKAREIIEEARFGVLATSVDGQPRVRPHAWLVTEDRELWSSTYASSGKVRELRANPRVELCFVDSRKRQVRVEGICSMEGGPAEKRALLELNPKVGRHFADESDPKYVHLCVRPSRVRYKDPGFSEYTEVDLSA